MSDLYNRYIDGKKPAEITHHVVTDISRGRINGVDLKSLISELERKNILDDSVVKTLPDSYWNDEYLELLAYEAVGGTFSKQYLLYLSKVADYVHAKSALDKQKKSCIINFIIVLVVVGILVLGVLLMIAFLRGLG